MLPHCNPACNVNGSTHRPADASALAQSWRAQGGASVSASPADTAAPPKASLLLGPPDVGEHRRAGAVLSARERLRESDRIDMLGWDRIDMLGWDRIDMLGWDGWMDRYGMAWHGMEWNGIQ